MHTHNAKGGTRFHYNPDGSGDVIVQSATHVRTREEITVPCTDLVEFVGELVRMARISELEQAQTTDLLGLRKP